MAIEKFFKGTEYEGKAGSMSKSDLLSAIECIHSRASVWAREQQSLCAYMDVDTAAREAREAVNQSA